jgi:hypothetical protein
MKGRLKAPASNQRAENLAPLAVGGERVSRALKSQKLWLSLTYLGLILLMARTYA